MRNHPARAPAIKEFLRERGYDFIELDDLLDGNKIIGTSTDVYTFKGTGLVGGHWNHAGHQAVGVFLARKVAERFAGPVLSR